MAKALAMTIGVEGIEIAIEYNAVNNRLTGITWTLAAGYVARARIWNSGNLVVDRTVGGPSTGVESIPGNLRMVEVTEGGQTFMDLPPQITFHFNLETIG